MKQFVIKSLFLIIIIACVDSLFGSAMRMLLDQTEKGDWGRNNYISNQVKKDMVILGSSRSIHHYDPQIFTDSLGLSCYNCGEDGMGILLMYARYKLICERQVPRLVIYEFLPEYDYKTEDNSRYLRFLRPLHNNNIVDSIIDAISPRERYKLLSGCYTYNTIFLDIISQKYSKSRLTSKDYTYTPLDGKMNYTPVSVKGSINKPKPDSLKVYYLQKLINDCLKNKTRLIFVTSPLFAGANDTSFDWLEEICKQNHISFYNHYNDSTFQSNSLFKDSHHLNRTGAERFSRIIAHEILSSTR